MEITKEYLKGKFGKKKTEGQDLAEQIYEFFGKQIKFGQLLGFIKHQGIQAVREIFEEFKKNGKEVTNPAGYFVGILKRNKTVWYN